jgi:hypothetical protein
VLDLRVDLSAILAFRQITSIGFCFFDGFINPRLDLFKTFVCTVTTDFVDFLPCEPLGIDQSELTGGAIASESSAQEENGLPFAIVAVRQLIVSIEYRGIRVALPLQCGQGRGESSAPPPP